MLKNTFYNLMFGFSNLLADAVDPGTVVNNVKNLLVQSLTWILIIVAAVGTIWAIVLGIQMARADSADKREEAKKRIVYTVVAFAVVLVLIVVFLILANNIEGLLGWAQSEATPSAAVGLLR